MRRKKKKRERKKEREREEREREKERRKERRKRGLDTQTAAVLRRITRGKRIFNWKFSQL